MLDKSLLKKHLTLVLNALLQNKGVGFTQIDEIIWYVMGYYAFAVPEKSDVFRHSMMDVSKPELIQKYFYNDRLLHQTGALFAEGNKQIEEWESESGIPVYLDNKLTKLFPPQKTKYFGGEKSTDFIVCKDKTMGDVVGLICPMSEKWIKELMKNKEEKQWKS